MIKSLKEQRNNGVTKNAVEELYRRCIKNIEMVNSVGKTAYVFSIPMFLPGHSLYDSGDVILGVSKKLKKEGFKIESSYDTNKIYVKW